MYSVGYTLNRTYPTTVTESNIVAISYYDDYAFLNISGWSSNEYDNLGRQTGSKAPGVGWVYTIYDSWDRPVLTQDANQRAKPTPEWNFAKYDVHNRIIISGTIATTSTRASLITAVANASTRDELRSTTSKQHI